MAKARKKYARYTNYNLCSGARAHRGSFPFFCSLMPPTDVPDAIHRVFQSWNLVQSQGLRNAIDTLDLPRHKKRRAQKMDRKQHELLF